MGTWDCNIWKLKNIKKSENILFPNRIYESATRGKCIEKTC